MFTLEERKKVVLQLIEFDMQYAITIRKLGYPNDRWPQEMPSEEEYLNAEKNLERNGYKVDYVITHTAPSESVFYLSKLQNLGIKNDVVEELTLTTFLDIIQEKLSYKHWFFGHFHVDLPIWRDQIAVLSSIREIETGRIVKQWENYEG